MAREIVMLWVGRPAREPWDGLTRRYRQRIERFVPMTEKPIRPAAVEDHRRLAVEAEALTEALPASAWTVALDRTGRQRSSPELAEWLRRLQDDWPHPLVFIVGSDLGLDGDFARGCRERLSLGPMTLPHELARVVLYEQLYRGLSIGAGIKYHRGPL